MRGTCSQQSEDSENPCPAEMQVGGTAAAQEHGGNTGYSVRGLSFGSRQEGARAPGDGKAQTGSRARRAGLCRLKGDVTRQEGPIRLTST